MTDTFKILICTDVHLGYKETDAVRGRDTFKSFEEILQRANQHDVDFILNAGDLFHVTRPSKMSLARTAALFTQYCVGNRQHAFTCHSPHDTNAHRLKMPMFIIHGNHDEPCGFGIKSPLHIFAEMRCLNYIGLPNKQNCIEPVLLHKGATKLALYAIGNTRDVRLVDQLRRRKLTFKPPPDNSYFNILMLHQDRPAPGRMHVVTDDALPRFMHLVIWGHEHEPLAPQQSETQSFTVYQPGSSIATSLCRSEAVEKSIGVLSVQKQQHRIQRIPLKTVRPVFLKEVDMRKSGLQPDASVQLVQTYLRKHVQAIVTRYEGDAMLPLVRVRVNVTGGYKRLIIKSFGAPFVGKVANPASLLSFQAHDGKNAGSHMENGNISLAVEPLHKRERIEALTTQFLEKTPLTRFDAKAFHDLFRERVQEEGKTTRFISDRIEALIKTKM